MSWFSSTVISSSSRENPATARVMRNFSGAFSPRATRYVACPVRLEDIAINGREANTGKVKAKGVCAPVYEVDEQGQPLDV